MSNKTRAADRTENEQQSAHAHSINPDEKNRFAVLCDLGADKVFVYESDRKTGKLTRNSGRNFYQSKPGAGPRHFRFHPNGKHAFVINELDSSVTALEYDAKSGTLRELQTVSTLPADFKSANNTCADVHVAPDGKFLYGSNRGHDSIASYKIDAESGELESVEQTSTGEKTPRSFVIEPNGRLLLAANQNSDSIVVFRVDEKTGKLSAVGNPIAAPSPVCLKPIPAFA